MFLSDLSKNREGSLIESNQILTSKLLPLNKTTEISSPNKGVLYCAINVWSYLEAAVISAVALHQQEPNLSIAIATNMSNAGLTSRLAQLNIWLLPVPLLNNQSSNTKTSRQVKTSIGELSPFDLTLYLDADILPLAPTGSIWNCPEDAVSLCLDLYPIVGACRHITGEELAQTINQCGANTPQYNSGVVLWSKNANSHALFNVWHQEWQKFKVQDQLALARAIHRTKTLVNLLPYTDNYPLSWALSDDPKRDNCKQVRVQELKERQIRFLHCYTSIYKIQGFKSIARALLPDATAQALSCLSPKRLLIHRSRPQLPKLPIHLFFEPTNTCNAACPLCPTGTKELNRKSAFLDFDLYLKILHEVEPQTIHFWNFGEPFLHPRIFDMFRAAANTGATTYASTNGFALYDPKNLDRLIDSGLTTLIVSLDGVDQATNSLYRRNVDFDRALEGLRELVKKRPFKLDIVWGFIVMRHNEHQLEAARNLAKELGVRFLPKTVCLDMLPERGNLEYLPQDNSKSRYQINGDQVELKVGQQPCHFVTSKLVILADGTVIPCCHDATGKLKLGDAKTQSIAEIWRGTPLAQLREQLTTQRAQLKPCSTCSVGVNFYLP